MNSSFVLTASSCNWHLFIISYNILKTETITSVFIAFQVDNKCFVDIGPKSSFSDLKYASNISHLDIFLIQ